MALLLAVILAFHTNVGALYGIGGVPARVQENGAALQPEEGEEEGNSGVQLMFKSWEKGRMKKGINKRSQAQGTKKKGMGKAPRASQGRMAAAPNRFRQSIP